jgi:transposase
VERAEAEAIYGQGCEVVVRVLIELSAQNERLTAQVELLSAQVAHQEDRIAQLERKSRRSSRNSSQPPSVDPPSAPPRRSKDPSGRKRGAQDGHEGHGRELLPACAVDEAVEHWPERYRCGHAFSDEERVAAGEPVRWQIEELPAITVGVSEHRAQRVRCPECGEHARAVLPDELAASAFGARLQAAVATLSVRNRISRRDVVELCEELFAARICTGTVEAILNRAGAALAEPHADLLERLRCSEAVNMG